MYVVVNCEIWINITAYCWSINQCIVGYNYTSEKFTSKTELFCSALFIQPAMQEIYKQWQASLKSYQWQYAVEYDDGNDEVFEAGEDEIDVLKLENLQQQQQQPIESYYRTRCKL